MVAASTNPAAATVLPEAVGCLNRYRRTAPGSWSGSASASASLSSPFSSVSSPVSASSSSSSSVLAARVRLLVVLELEAERQRQRRAGRGGLARVVGQRRGRIVVVAVAVAVAVVGRGAGGVVLPVALRVAEQGGEHAGQGVDLVRAQLEAVGQVRLVLRQDPLQAEHQREPAPPGGGRRRQTGVDLEQRLVVGGAERGARRKRHRGVVAHRDEAIASPPLDSLELGRLNAGILRCLGGDLFGQPRTSVGRSAACLRERPEGRVHGA